MTSRQNQVRPDLIPSDFEINAASAAAPAARPSAKGHDAQAQHATQAHVKQPGEQAAAPAAQTMQAAQAPELANTRSFIKNSNGLIGAKARMKQVNEILESGAMYFNVKAPPNRMGSSFKRNTAVGLRHPRWAEIIEGDKQRKKLLDHDLFEASILNVLFRWHGTVWHAALTAPRFYFPLIFWLVPVVMRHTDMDAYEQLPDIGEHIDQIESIGAFVGFFVLFYANQCYERWWNCYQTSMKCVGCINDMAFMCRSSLGRDSPHAAQILRYTNLLHVLGYVGLTREYDDEFFVLIAADLNLATREEMKALSAIGPSNGSRCYREVAVWALDAINRAKRTGAIREDEASNFMDRVLLLQDHITTLYDYAFQPVPFLYFNMANWLLAGYLPMLTYALATTVGESNAILSFLIVLLANICLVGLSCVALRFLHPYGMDVEDLAVYHFIDDAAKNSLAILDSTNTFGSEDDHHRARYMTFKPEGAYAKAAAKQRVMSEPTRSRMLPGTKSQSIRHPVSTCAAEHDV